MDNIREAVWSGTSSNIYTGWAIYLKTLKYLENYALDKKKWVMKVVRLEGGHPMIPNSTPHCHPLGVEVGGRLKTEMGTPIFYCTFGFSRKKKYPNLTY